MNIEHRVLNTRVLQITDSAGRYEKFKCRYNMRKISQYNDMIFPVWCYSENKQFYSFTPPNLYMYSHLHKQYHRVKYFPPRFVYIRWVLIDI